jgi:hypothetical protein
MEAESSRAVVMSSVLLISDTPMAGSVAPCGITPTYTRAFGTIAVIVVFAISKARMIAVLLILQDLQSLVAVR